MKSQEEQWLLTEKHGGEKSGAFYADCKALALGEPLAYLIGHTPFLDCTIYLDSRPLVPRVETEFWVNKAIETIQESLKNQPDLFEAGGPSVMAETRKNNTRFEDQAPAGPMVRQPIQAQHSLTILDLCAGSGCIGVAVAQAVPEALVDFAEIDRRLLPTIQKNIDSNLDNPTRCTIYHSNLFAGLPAEQKYSFILSNPPYIDPALNRVDESVRDFEPHLALFGGAQGMDVIAQLIGAAPDHLTTLGQLWIEHEPEQVAAIGTLAQTHGFTVTHHCDQYGVIRYSVLVLS